MGEKQFDLLEEPWLKVLTNDMEEKEVSLIELFAYAHEYKQLAGETATQDAAIYRFLLAVLATVFYRYEVDGTEELLSEENEKDPTDVIERWREYRNQGYFTEAVFRNYLKAYSERFWLFHPETPFYQVADLEYGTDYDGEEVVCLYGNIKESKNEKTKHHFSMMEGNQLKYIEPSAAVRWLIHFNAYAIRVKPNNNSPDQFNSAVNIGRMARIGFILVKSDNVFQTLLLNLCALKDGKDLWGKPSPIWERAVRKKQTQEIAIPDNIPEAYTIQSRRIFLKKNNNGMICGFRVLGGDYYVIALSEQ